MAKNKLETLSIIFDCAQKYKENLVNRSLLFVCNDKQKRIYCVEVTFDESNFQHLTGVKINRKKISPKDFYNRCLEKRLSPDDFEFSDTGTTELKLQVLPTLMCKNLSAKMIGDYNMSQPKLFTEKLAGGVSACMGFVRNNGKGRYIPNTVLRDDVRVRAKHADRIIATFRKRRNEIRYTEPVYLAKNADWQKVILPEKYKYLSVISFSDWSKKAEEDGCCRNRPSIEY